jgi:hypothetical protein
MRFTKRLMLLTLATSALAGSCKKSKFEGFDETDSGLSYKFFIQKDGQKPKEGDVITLKLKYFNEKDSLLFDSKSIGRPFMVQVPKPSFKGSFEEGFTMMSLGDSVAFMNSADSFFTKIVHGDLPPQIKKGSFLKFCFKLDKIQSKADLEKEQAEQQKKMDEANAGRMSEEKGAIDKYVADKKITVAPTASGLYFMETHKGSGAQVKAGDTVYVKYTGKTLDGKVFDTSDRSPVPVKFQIGVGQVIKGWDEALVMMHVGSKATILLPSSIAYGAQGAGPQIPPFSPLLFDVEVYKIGGKK